MADYTPMASVLKPEEELTWSWKCGKRDVEVKRYWLVNIIAALLHGVNALLMVIFYYANDKHDQLYKITTSYASWQRSPNSTDTWDIVQKQATVIEGLSLNWLIFAFHILSFIFQFAALIPAYHYVERITEEGRNPLRFAEYSLSASIMLVCIALLCGIRDIIILLAISILTAVCQILGGVAEYQLPGTKRTLTHFLAWDCISAAYATILTYFFVAINMNDVSPPAYVMWIVIFQAALFLSFGFVQLIQFYGQTWWLVGAIGRQAEISYTVLSLVAKTLLGWMIYANVIVAAS
jgi:hypothetical protein